MRVLPHALVCQEAIELVSDYLDGALSRRDRRRLEKHLAKCDACVAYVEQIRVMIAASSLVRLDDLSSEALETLTDLFRRFHDEK